MNKRMISTIATVCLLTACGGSESPTTGTGSTTTSGGGGGTTAGTGGATTSAAGTGGSGGGMSAHPLQEGDYTGVSSSVADDTCKGIVIIAAPGPLTLAWSSATDFTLGSKKGESLDCTFDKGAGSCLPFMPFMAKVGVNTVLNITSPDRLVKVVSSTEFIFTETFNADCVGSGCAALEMQKSVKFPCGLTSNEDYSM